MKIYNTLMQYGTGYPFYRFYLFLRADGSYYAALMLQYTAASLYILPQSTDLEYQEAAEFIRMLPNLTSLHWTGMDCQPIRDVLINGKWSSGTAMQLVQTLYGTSPPPECRENFLPFYQLLRHTFGDTYFPKENDLTWYCELSHAVRHGSSALYFLPGKAGALLTGLLYPGIVSVAQIAVEPSLQNHGIGSSFLSAICAEYQRQGRAIYVDSCNTKSDRFYTRLGFAAYAHWYQFESYGIETEKDE